jgi:RNA polymerase sigma-70 factor (ECF subfamily)
MTPELAHSVVKTNASDELDLVHASKRGNVAAFETLVKRYDCGLLRIANSVTHNIEDSQDAVQEALLKTYQHLAKFREASPFSTWLIRITVNQSLMKLRRHRAVREVPLDGNCRQQQDTAATELTDRTPNPEQLYWASEFRDVLAHTLEEVRPSLRVVFVLREITGLSINQRSIVLGVSHTAVKARLWRARLQIREGLSEHYKNPPTT